MAVMWVFRRVPELKNEQGFVDVPDALRPRLIAENKAADVFDASLHPEPEPAAGQADDIAEDPAPEEARPRRKSKK